jgi:hypothetical protein
MLRKNRSSSIEMRFLRVAILGQLILSMGMAQTSAPSSSAPSNPAPTGSDRSRDSSAKASSGSSSAPHKVVVRDGGAKEPSATIVSGMSPAESERSRQKAQQWLDNSDDALRQLAGRSLRPDQQETVIQIRNYMKGAQTALTDGDMRRASTLALKAHWLSDDLVKQGTVGR